MSNKTDKVYLERDLDFVLCVEEMDTNLQIINVYTF